MKNVKVHKPKVNKRIGNSRAAMNKAVDDEIREAVLAKGDYKKASFFSEAELRSKQREAIALLTDYLTPLKDRHVASILGIHLYTLNAWRYDPEFMKMLDFEISRKKSLMRLEAYKGLFRAIKQGDTKTITTYFKMTGDLTEEVNINLNDPSEMSKEALEQEIRDMEKQLGVSRKSKPSKR